MNGLLTSALIAGLFLIGLLGGVWTVIAPWVVGFPQVGNGSWNSMTWASVGTGVLVLTASAAGLVVMAAALAAPQQAKSQPPSGGRS